MIINLKMAALTAGLVISSLNIVPSIAIAQTMNVESIKTVSIRVMKTVNGWVRIMDTGQVILLSIQEARDLGLSPTAAVGHVVTVVALDTFEDAAVLASDVGALSRYVAVDVAMPLIAEGYSYTEGIIIPKSKELISDGVAFAQTTAIPVAKEALSDAYDAAAPMVSDAADYTRETIVPNASDLATSARSGIKSLWNRVTK